MGDGVFLLWSRRRNVIGGSPCHGFNVVVGMQGYIDPLPSERFGNTPTYKVTCVAKFTIFFSSYRVFLYQILLKYRDWRLTIASLIA